MAPSLCISLDDRQQTQLLDIARQSIQAGFASDQALRFDPARLESDLGSESAVFVTLSKQGQLRGCIGSLEAREPLAQAVATAAFNAAFRDRRFQRLGEDEFDTIDIEVSILSPMETIDVDDRQDLLAELRPGIDGLLLEDKGQRATFLPKVWEKIGSADEFVTQLLLKAGLTGDHWSDSLRCYRYHTLNLSEK